MARIRTVKPELLLHEGLFALEKKTGFPIRIAWVGLLTASDREGRFKWQPNILKLQILPWDELDFSRVLEALKLDGFIKQYTVKGKTYGYIPSFNIHQRVKSDEAQSQLPSPPEYAVYDELEAAQLLAKDNSDTDSTPVRSGSVPVGYEPATRESPIVVVEVEMERERERKGNTAKPFFEFDRIYEEYPRKEGKQEGLKHCKSQIKTQETYDQVLSAVRRYRAQCEREGIEKKFIKHFSSFMHGGKWRDFLDPDVGTSTISSSDEPFSIAKILASKGEAHESDTVRSADPKASK